MTEKPDQPFFDRADAFIGTANGQLNDAPRGQVSASLMYATARFSAWVSATGFDTGAQMADEKDKIVDYFVTEFRSMMAENYDDYVKNFDRYTAPNEG